MLRFKPTFKSRPLPHAYAWAPIIFGTFFLGLDLILEMFWLAPASQALSQFSQYLLAAIGALMAIGSSLILIAFFREGIKSTTRVNLEQTGTLMVAFAWAIIAGILYFVTPDTYFFTVLCLSVSFGAFNRTHRLWKEQKEIERRVDYVGRRSD